MGISIRFNDQLYQEAKQIAQAEYRTIPHQIEFWATVGKCALDNPDLPIEFIRDVLVSRRQARSLAEPFDIDSADE